MNLNISVIAIFWIVIGGMPCDASDKLDLTTSNALYTVANPESSAIELQTAWKHLDSVKGDSSFWLEIGSNKKYDATRRRKCLKHFFDHLAPPEMPLGELLKLINVPVDWISCRRIQKLSELNSGPLPHGLMTNRTRSIFVIPILPEEGGSYRLQIYISFSENLDLDIVKQMFGGAVTKTNAVDRTLIIGCASWDSDEQQGRYPGSKLQF